MLFEALLEENKREESEKTFLFRRKKPFQDIYEQCKRKNGFSEHIAFRLVYGKRAS